MGTQQTIEMSFRELLESRPIDKISVSDICAAAGLSRKTFYFHFRDKSDIIEQILRRDVTHPVSVLDELLAHADKDQITDIVFERFYRSIWNDRDFYRRLVSSSSKASDLFVQATINAIYALDRELFSRLGYEVPEMEQDYVAYFFSSAQAMLLQKWVKDGMQMAPKELARLHKQLIGSFWESISQARC